MMLCKIKVYANGALLKKRIWAWKIGTLAVHKTLSAWTFCVGDDDTPEQYEWTVTHVPTGLRVGQPMPRHLVPVMLQNIQAARWRGMSPFEDIPACELLELAPEIAADLKFTFDDGDVDYWKRAVQKPVLRDLRCHQVDAPDIPEEWLDEHVRHDHA